MEFKTNASLLGLAVTFALCGCNGERSLPNGYRWFSIYGDTGIIVDRHGREIIGLEVSSTTLRIVGEDVYGVREVGELIGNPPRRIAPIEGHYGKFRVDTTTGAVAFTASKPKQ